MDNKNRLAPGLLDLRVGLTAALLGLGTKPSCPCRGCSLGGRGDWACSCDVLTCLNGAILTPATDTSNLVFWFRQVQQDPVYQEI